MKEWDGGAEGQANAGSREGADRHLCDVYRIEVDVLEPCQPMNCSQ